MSNLVIIPCCQVKDENGEELFPEERKVVDFLKDEHSKQLLKEGRNMCRGDITGNKLLSAFSMYIGYLYKVEELKNLIKEKLAPNFHVLIISASYGLLRPEERIRYYNKKMNENYNVWKERLPYILESYIKDNNIENVYAFVGKSEFTSYYYKVIKRCKWTQLRNNKFKNGYLISLIKGSIRKTPVESGKIAVTLIKNGFDLKSIDKEKFSIREL